MNAEDRASLEANKREMFDGMRAYQQSEHAHKNDAIALLTTILTAVGALVAAVVLPDKAVPSAPTLAFLAAVAATVGTYFVVSSTNAKIAADHGVYAAFGAEYVRTCEALGYYASIGGIAALKHSRAIGQGQGYVQSQRILLCMGWIVVLGAWLAFVYVAFGLAPAPPA